MGNRGRDRSNNYSIETLLRDAELGSYTELKELRNIENNGKVSSS